MDTEFLAVRSYETRPPARGAPSSDDKRQAADQNRQQDARADTIPPAEERDGGFSLATYPANAAERRLALWAVIVSAAVFAVIAPFAKVKLAQVWAFIPAYQSALVINDLITAALLFGQYSHFRSRALLVLSCGYLFTASLAIVHALSFPGLFAPTGLLNAGPQTTAWLYMVWHIGFPLTVIAYAILKNRETVDTSVAKGALIGSIAVFTTVAVLAAIATVGHAGLPVIMQGNGYTPILVVVVASVWLFSLAALVVLLWQRRQTVLDLWLMVVMCAWLFDIALAALLNAGRFDLGFYAGRVYGLCAATFVLGVLLVEHSRLYARLLETHMKERLASQAKSRFLATMSHELRTPLNAIMGFTKVLLMKLPGPLTDAQEKQLTTVHGSAKHLLAVINDLLDVAKVEAGKIDFHPEPVDCRHLVQELGCSLRPLAERKGLRLDCRYGGTSEAVNTDKRVLTQILMNLVNNAIKYTHHGNVTVTCAQRAEGENFISEISVADTGIGIRKEDQAKLFDAFLRIPQEGAAESTGLGLYYSRKLADVIGARITFTSEFGKGSTFTVTLKGALRKG